MKTNPSARWLSRIKVYALYLALSAVVGMTVLVGESLASRFGQGAAGGCDGLQAPSMGIADLMAAAH